MLDAQGNLRNVIDLYRDVAFAMEGATSQEKAMAAEGLAGKYQIARMQALLDSLGDVNGMYDQIMETQQHATGSAIEENEEYLKSFEARLAQTRRKLEELGLAIGDAFLSETMVQTIELFGKALEAVTAFTQKYGMLPILFGLTSTALVRFSTTFRTWMQALVFGSSELSKTQRQLVGLKNNLTQAEVASKAFQRTWKSMAVMTGLGIGSMALGFAFEKIIAKFGEARQKSEELRNEFENSKRAYMDNADEINNLVKEYEKLENASKDTSLTNEERSKVSKDLLETQEKLAGLMPNMVVAEDEYGNKIYQSSEFMKTRNEMLQHQIELEKQKAELEEKTGRLEQLKSEEQAIKDLNKEINSTLSFIQNLGQASSALAFNDAKMFDIQNLEDANNMIGELRARLAELRAGGENKQADNLESFILQIEEQALRLGLAQADINARQFEIVTIYANNLQEVLNTNNKIGESSEQVIGSLGIMLSQLDLTGEEVQRIFNDLSNSVQADEDLQAFASAYDTALRNLENSVKNHDLTPTVANKEKLDSDIRVVESAFINLKNKLLEIMSSTEGFDSNMFGEMERQLDGLMVKLLDGKISLDEFSKATGIPLDKLNTDLLMVSGDMEEFSDVTDEASISIEELNERLTTMGGLGVGELGEIKKSFEEINETTDQLLTSLELYTYTLEDATQAEIDHANALIESGYQTDQLTFKELELIGALEGEDKAIQELLARYPFLLTAEDMAKLSKDELIAKIKEEMLAQDLLIGGMELVAKGQASEQESRNINTFRGTRFRINQYRDELQALKTLQSAMQQHYENAYNTYNEMKKMAPGSAHEAMAEHEALVAHQNLSKMKQKSIDVEIKLNQELNTQSQQMKGLQRIQGILSGATSNYGKQLDKAQKAQEKGTKGNKKNAKAKKDNAKATKTKAEAEEMASFIADKYKRAIEELNLALKQQNAIKSSFPKHSAEYRDALEKEIALERQKLNLMQSQAKELQSNIAQGRVTQTGVISHGTTAKPKQQVVLPQTTTQRKLSGWQARVNSGFGYRKHPISGTQKLHAGVDMAQPLGTKLESNIAGIVKKAFYDKQGYGNVIYVVDNSGTEHRYAHLSKIGVKAGQKVGVGDYLGNIGSTGRSTGPHLHYETLKNGKHVNPMAWVNQAKGVKSITSGGGKIVQDVKNVNKEVAQTANDLYGLQSDVLNLQGEIIDQQMKIEELQLEVLRSELAVYEKRRSQFGWHIDWEVGKREELEQTSQRYLSTLDRQMKFMDQKQKVNGQELVFLEALIKSQTLQGNALEEVQNRYDELRLTMQQLQHEMANLRKEQIDAQILHWSRAAEQYEFRLSILQQTIRANAVGTTKWKSANEELISTMKQKRTAIQGEINQLTQLLKTTTGLNPQAVLDYQQRLRELTLAYRDLGLSIEEAMKSAEEAEKQAWAEIADKVIEAYKNAIKEKQDMHIKSLDDELKAEDERHKKIMDNYRKELDAFKKIVDEKLKQIDKDDTERSYENEIKEIQDKRQEVENKISLLSLDDSREARYERERLNKELSELDKTLEEKRYQREKELRKESLNDLVKDKEEEISQKEQFENDYHESEKERIDDLKEYWNQHYTDLLNDERKFAKMREDIMNQNFENIEREFLQLANLLEITMPDLENTLNGTMQAVGTAIRQNIIDELRESIRLMNELNNAMSGATGGGDFDWGFDLGMDNAGLAPTNKTSLSQADLDVMVGKIIRHELAPILGKTQQEKKKYEIMGSDLANAGRDKGSTITNQPSYDSLVKEMAKEDTQAIAEAMKKYAGSLPSTEYVLKDWLNKEADKLKLATSFNGGGYTGNWSGNQGRYALMHKQEYVLTDKETNKFGNLMSKFDAMGSLLDGVENNNSTKIIINIDNMSGDKEDVERIGDALMNRLKRERGIR